MLIGIDANQANKDQKSGIEWYSFHIIKELKKLSCQPQYQDLKFVLYSNFPLKGELAKLPENWEFKVLKWINLPFWNFWTQIRLSFELLLHPADVFFAPGYTLPLIHPKKSFVAIHDIAFEYFPKYYSRISRLYLKLITKYSLKFASKIIVPSKSTKQGIMRKYNYPENKILITALGYDQELFKPIKDSNLINQVLDKYNISKSYLLYIGRLDSKKNIFGLVKAFHGFLMSLRAEQSNLFKYKKIKLVLIGLPGFGWDKVKNFIKNNHLNNQIIYPGYVPEKDLSYLLSGAECFIFPSHFEGFGLPVLEAMAAGTPVITSKTTSLPEVAGEAALLINPQNIDEIAKAIKKIIDNPNLKNKLSKLGIQQAKKFSWSNTAKKTLRILIS